MHRAGDTQPGALGPADAPEAAEALVAHLLDVDANCPACSAPLRGLAAPACPTCRQPLVLSLDDRPPRFGWFLVTVMPGCMTGGVAFIVVLVICWFGLQPRPAWPMFATVMTMAFADAVLGLWAYAHRARLIWQPPPRQRLLALAAWGAHVLVVIGVNLAAHFL